MGTVSSSKVADDTVERKREEDCPFNQLKAALNSEGHVVDARGNASVSLTSSGLNCFIKTPDKLASFIQEAFSLKDGSRITQAQAKGFAGTACAHFLPPEPPVATAATLQVALTEEERGCIPDKPRPFRSIQFGGESLPYTRSHLSMLYWRLGLCQRDKFECLALGDKLNAYIDGLRTEREEVGPRIVALIGTSGSGKTRSLLELLCLRFGLFLVADTCGNGGAEDFAEAVLYGKLCGGDHDGFARRVAACVLARLLVLQHARANGWTPTQFLNIQLLDSGLFLSIQLRLRAASLADLHAAIHHLLKLLNIKGLPIIIDEAQVLLPDKPSRSSLFKVATATLAVFTKAWVAPGVLIVSGTSIALKDVGLRVASGLLKRDHQSIRTMVPSPLTADDVTNVVRQVLRSEPAAAVGELLRGRGRFVMTFLREVLSAEIADAERGVVPRARAQPAATDTRASKRARTAASGAAAGVRVGAGAGAGAAAARDVAVAGYVDGSGDGEVSVANVTPRMWDTGIWLEHLASAERLMLFGGRSTAEYLTRAVSRFYDKVTRPGDHFRSMTALGKAAVTAALGAENDFIPRGPSEALWLLQTGLASVNGAEQVVVYEPLVWRAILVVVLEQHTQAFEDLLSTTMKLAYAASASALRFFYKLVQPSRWAAMFHGHFVDEVPLFNTWHPSCLPAGQNLGQVYNGRMEVVGVDEVFERSGYASPFRGSIIEWLRHSYPLPVCLPPLDEGPDACMVVKLSSKDGNAVLHVLMFTRLKAMRSPLKGQELQHAKDGVTVGRMGNVEAAVKNAGTRQRGTDRAVALAKSVNAWTKANGGVVLGWLVCPLSSLPQATEVSETVGAQTLFNVDARALKKAADSDAGGASCEVLVKGTMFAELTKWSSSN